MKVALDFQPSEPGRVLLYDRKFSPPWTGPPHRHSELECNLILSGEARLVLGERRVHLLPRGMAWLFPSQDHSLAEISEDFRMWVWVFRQNFLREWTDDNAAELRKKRAATRCLRLPASIAELLSAVGEQTWQSAADSPLRRAGLAWLLCAGWQAFAASREEAPSDDVHPAVARAIRLLQKDPCLEQLPQLAPAAGLSYSRLSRLFHQEVGMTLSQFRTRERLHKFLLLYNRNQTSSTMLECATEAGFASYVQFYRCFRSHYGIGPRQYLATAQPRK